MRNQNGEEIYLDDFLPAILSADATDLEDILYWIRQRYGQLYPQYELHIMSIDRQGDRIQQIDRVIAMLKQFKYEK